MASGKRGEFHLTTAAKPGFSNSAVGDWNLYASDPSQTLHIGVDPDHSVAAVAVAAGSVAVAKPLALLADVTAAAALSACNLTATTLAASNLSVASTLVAPAIVAATLAASNVAVASNLTAPLATVATLSNNTLASSNVAVASTLTAPVIANQALSTSNVTVATALTTPSAVAKDITNQTLATSNVTVASSLTAPLATVATLSNNTLASSNIVAATSIAAPQATIGALAATSSLTAPQATITALASSNVSASNAIVTNALTAPQATIAALASSNVSTSNATVAALLTAPLAVLTTLSNDTLSASNAYVAALAASNATVAQTLTACNLVNSNAAIGALSNSTLAASNATVMSTLTACNLVSSNAAVATLSNGTLAASNVVVASNLTAPLATVATLSNSALAASNVTVASNLTAPLATVTTLSNTTLSTSNVAVGSNLTVASRVGINTAAPTSALDVRGQLTLCNDSGWSSGGVRFRDTAGTADAGIAQGVNGALAFRSPGGANGSNGFNWVNAGGATSIMTLTNAGALSLPTLAASNATVASTLTACNLIGSNATVNTLAASNATVQSTLTACNLVGSNAAITTLSNSALAASNATVMSTLTACNLVGSNAAISTLTNSTLAASNATVASTLTACNLVNSNAAIGTLTNNTLAASNATVASTLTACNLVNSNAAIGTLTNNTLAASNATVASTLTACNLVGSNAAITTLTSQTLSASNATLANSLTAPLATITTLSNSGLATSNVTVSSNLTAPLATVATLSNTILSTATVVASASLTAPLATLTTLSNNTLAASNATVASTLTACNLVGSNAAIGTLSNNSLAASNATVASTLTACNLVGSNAAITTLTSQTLSASNATVAATLTACNLVGSNAAITTLTSQTLSASNATVAATLTACNLVGSNAAITTLTNQTLSASNATLANSLTAPLATITTLSNSGLATSNVTVSSNLTAPLATVATLSNTILSTATVVASASLTAPLATLTTLSNNTLSASNVTVASNLTAPLATIATLSNQTLSASNVAVASNLTAPLATLTTLSNQVLAASNVTVASNLTAPLATVTTLSNNTLAASNVAVASNLTAPLATVATLSNQVLATSNVTVASNLTAPLATVTTLSNTTLSTSNVTVGSNLTVGSRVGINTASPSSALDVRGQLTLCNDSGWTTGGIRFRDTAGGVDAGIVQGNNGQLIFRPPSGANGSNGYTWTAAGGTPNIMTLTNAGALSMNTLAASNASVPGTLTACNLVNSNAAITVLSTQTLAASNVTAAVSLTTPSLTATVSSNQTLAASNVTASNVVASNLTVNGPVVISGDLTVNGTTTTINANNLNIADNILVINNGQTNPPPSTLTSGLEVNRGGTLSNAQLLYTESNQLWKVGVKGGALNTLATRAEQVTDRTIAFFDAPSSNYQFSSGLVYTAAGQLGVGTSAPAYTVEVAGTVGATTASNQSLAASNAVITQTLTAPLATVTTLSNAALATSNVTVQSNLTAPLATITTLSNTALATSNVTVFASLTAPSATVTAFTGSNLSASNATVGTLSNTALATSNVTVFTSLTAPSATVTAFTGSNLSASNAAVGTLSNSALAASNVTVVNTLTAPAASVSTMSNLNLGASNLTVVIQAKIPTLSNNALAASNVTVTSNLTAPLSTITTLSNNTLSASNVVVASNLTAPLSTITTLSNNALSASNVVVASNLTAPRATITALSNTSLYVTGSAAVQALAASNLTASNAVFLPAATFQQAAQVYEDSYPNPSLAPATSNYATASTTSSASNAYLAFDGAAATSWLSGTGLYNATSGAYAFTNSTTVGGTTYSGEYLQVQLPGGAIVPSSYALTPGATTAYAPTSWTLLAGSNGTLLSNIDARAGVQWTPNVQQVFTLPASAASNAYDTFRLVVSAIGNTADTNRAKLEVAEVLYRSHPVRSASATYNADSNLLTFGVDTASAALTLSPAAGGTATVQTVAANTITASNITCCNLTAPSVTTPSSTASNLTACNVTVANTLTASSNAYIATLSNNLLAASNATVQSGLTACNVVASNIAVNALSNQTLAASNATVQSTLTACNVVASNAAIATSSNQTLAASNVTVMTTLTACNVTASNATVQSALNASNITVTGTISTPAGVAITNGNPGDMVSKAYGSVGDRYGFGQYNSGVARIFASSTISSSVRISKPTDATTTGGAGFTDLMTVLTSNGFVGVGTAAPLANLHLNNDCFVQANNSAWNSNITTPGLYMRYATVGTCNAAYIQSVTRSNLTWQNMNLEGSNLYFNTGAATGTSASNRMVITAAGNVGVGTTTPAYTLEVAGTVGAVTSSNNALAASNATVQSTLTACNLVSSNAAVGTLSNNALAASNATVIGTLTASNVAVSNATTNALTLVGTTPSREYPPAALTSDLYALSGQAYANGLYVCSTPNGGGSNVCNIFNKDLTDQYASVNTFNNNVWSGSSITVNSTTYAGIAFVVSMPTAITLSTFALTRYNINVAPRDFTVFGSTDGTTWTQLFSTVNEVWSVNTNTYTVNAANAYSNYMLIVTAIAATGLYLFRLSEWQLYGTEGALATVPTLTNSTVTTSNATVASRLTARTAIVTSTLSVGTTGTATSLLLGNSADSNASRFLSALDSTMATNDARHIAFGKSNSASNQAELTYIHQGDGAASNKLQIGFFGQSSSNRFTITAAGYVGIGTSNPESTLGVVGTGTSGANMVAATLTNTVGGTNTSTSLDFRTYASACNANARVALVDAGGFGGHMTFSTKPTSGSETNNLTERLRITSVGNVGIGTSSPAYKLEVAGTVGATTATVQSTLTACNLVSSNAAVTTLSNSALAASNATVQSTLTACNITASNITVPVLTAPSVTASNLAASNATVVGQLGVGIGAAAPAYTVDVSAGSIGAATISNNSLAASNATVQSTLTACNVTASNATVQSTLTACNATVQSTLTACNVTASNATVTTMSNTTLAVSGGAAIVGSLDVGGSNSANSAVGAIGGQIRLGGLADDATLNHAMLLTQNVTAFQTEMLLYKGNDPNDQIRLRAGTILFDTFSNAATGGFYNGPSNIRMAIMSNGNVGIGTTTPASLLDVAGTANFATSIITPAATITTTTGSNVNASNITVGTLSNSALAASNATVQSTLTACNIVASNITVPVLTAPSVTASNLAASNATVVGQLGVGIGAAAPAYTVDVSAGSIGAATICNQTLAASNATVQSTLTACNVTASNIAAATSSNNTLAASNATITGAATIGSSTFNGTPLVVNTSNAILANLFRSTISNNQNIQMYFGKNGSTNNAAFFTYTHAGGDGSATNNIKLGIYGAPTALTLDGSGAATAYSLTVNTTASVTTSLTTPLVAATTASNQTLAASNATVQSTLTACNLVSSNASVGTLSNNALAASNATVQSALTACNVTASNVSVANNATLGTSTTTGTPLSVVGSNSSSTTAVLATMYNPTLSNNSNVALFMGKNSGTNNMAFMTYTHRGGDGSSSNYGGLGVWGSSSVLHWTGSSVGVRTSAPTASLDVNGTANVSTSLTTPLLVATTASNQSLAASNVTASNVVASNLTVNGPVTISGDLTVNGTTTTINANNLNITDNVLVINNGQTNPPPSTLTAGLEVNRGGTLSNAQLVWTESNQLWKTGIVGGAYNTLATRVEQPQDRTIAFFDATTCNYQHTSNLVWSAQNELGVGTSNPNYLLEVAGTFGAASISGQTLAASNATVQSTLTACNVVASNITATTASNNTLAASNATVRSLLTACNIVASNAAVTTASNNTLAASNATVQSLLTACNIVASNAAVTTASNNTLAASNATVQSLLTACNITASNITVTITTASNVSASNITVAGTFTSAITTFSSNTAVVASNTAYAALPKAGGTVTGNLFTNKVYVGGYTNTTGNDALNLGFSTITYDFKGTGSNFWVNSPTKDMIRLQNMDLTSNTYYGGMLARVYMPAGGVGGSTGIYTYDDRALIGLGFVVRNGLATPCNIEALSIRNNGYIGIGNSNPLSLLDVNGSETTATGTGAAISLQNLASTTSNEWYLRAGGPGTSTPDGGFSVGDCNALRLVLDSNGNVGIGKSNPARPLDLVSGVGSFGMLGLTQSNSASNECSMSFTNALTSWYAGISCFGSGASNFGIASPSGLKMCFTGAGNVGIGTATPAYTLDVAGDINFTGTLRQNGTAFSGGGSTATTLTASNTNTSNLYVQNFAGIGTSAPQATLHLNNDYFIQANAGAWNSNITTPGLYMRYATNGTCNAAYIQSVTRSNLTWQNMNLEGSNLYFNTVATVGASASNRMVITAAGNVGIGTSSPTNVLEVAGNTKLAYTIVQYNLDVYGDINASCNVNVTASGKVLRATTLSNNTLATSNVYVASNVGIGTTTPAYSLDVNGTIRAGAAGVAGLLLGTSTDNASTRFISAQDSTMAVGGQRYLQIGHSSTSSNCAELSYYHTGSGSGSNQLRMGFYGDATVARGMTLMASGNVGIGTTSPNAPLQFTSVNAQRKIVLYEDANNDYQTYGFGMSAYVLRYQVANTTASHIFYAGTSSTAATELMRVQGNGYVGIGTSAPNAPLQFNNNVANRKVVLYENVNNDFQFYGFGISNTSGVGLLRYHVGTTGDAHAFYAGSSSTAATELMRVQGNGYVGIATSAPETALHVAGYAVGTNVTLCTLHNYAGTAGAQASMDFKTYNVAGATPGARVSCIDDGNLGGHLALYSKPSGNNTNPVTERVRITSAGYVGIGTTSPACKLHVSGNDTGGGAESRIALANTASTNSWYMTAGGPGSAVPNGGFCIHDNNRYNITITSAGNVGINTTTPGATLAVNGSVSKTSGTFDIVHPDPAKAADGYHLRHSFVESPTRGDNIYRYTVTTANCTASITLPPYFAFLNEDPQVWISAADVLGMGYGKVNAALDQVDVTVSTDGTYNVLVIATRKDKDAVQNFDGTGGIEYIPAKESAA